MARMVLIVPDAARKYTQGLGNIMSDVAFRYTVIFILAFIAGVLLNKHAHAMSVEVVPHVSVMSHAIEVVPHESFAAPHVSEESPVFVPHGPIVAHVQPSESCQATDTSTCDDNYSTDRILGIVLFIVIVGFVILMIGLSTW